MDLRPSLESYETLEPLRLEVGPKQVSSLLNVPSAILSLNLGKHLV